VEAQAKDCKTTPKKQLKQLICTEEQQTHAWQIKRANHTLRRGGGLTKVTTTMSTGGVNEHHYAKMSIKEACLAKAKAPFTQANDMAFLMEPLILELGIIDTYISRRIMAMGHYLLGRPWGVGLGKLEK